MELKKNYENSKKVGDTFPVLADIYNRGVHFFLHHTSSWKKFLENSKKARNKQVTQVELYYRGPGLFFT